MRECDYVIVGAGSAGCVLANRLSADSGVSVVLLEAGGRDTRSEVRVPAAFSRLFKSSCDWNFTTVPQPAMADREMYWPRGRMLGGSSSMNAQMHVRGNPADFDNWRALGNPGWGWNDVLPYFRRAENCARGESSWRGAAGPMEVAELREVNPATHAFVRAAQQAGIPLNPDINRVEQDGVDYTQVTQRNGRRWSAADAYLRPAMKRANLTVVTNAEANRVIIEKGLATGVEFRRGDRVDTIHARREVLLAAGAIGSPQLLLLSGIGDGESLRALGIQAHAHLPGVGQNLQDHLAAGIVVRAKQPITLAGAETIPNVLRFLLRGRGALTSNVAEAMAFVRSDSAAPAPDIELLFAPAAFINHGFTKPGGHALTIGVVLLTPRSSGRIWLRSADPRDPPAIDPRYLTHPDDVPRLLAGLRMARSVFMQPALAALAGEPILPSSLDLDDAELIELVRSHAETLYHPVGTCRMGTDSLAVVDPALRVHGVRALRVIDASVMPAIVRGHTHAATVMIAEKGSDLVIQAVQGIARTQDAARRTQN